MTYSAYDTGYNTAQPAELYDFQMLPTVWRYTSADEELTWSGVTWAPAAIERDGLTQSTELGRQTIQVRVPRDFAVAELFRLAPPPRPIALTIRQYHRSDPDAEATVVWVGRVMSAEWDEIAARLACEPVWNAIKRPALLRHYGLGCPWRLYGVGCGLNATAWRVEDQVSAIAGAVVSLPAAAGYPSGYFDGGYLDWLASDGVMHRRYIVSHSGVSLTLATAPLGLSASDLAGAYPGCDHTLTTCDSKFANALNFGGFPWRPSKNPMGGATIW